MKSLFLQLYCALCLEHTAMVLLHRDFGWGGPSPSTCMVFWVCFNFILELGNHFDGCLETGLSNGRPDSACSWMAHKLRTCFKSNQKIFMRHESKIRMSVSPSQVVLGHRCAYPFTCLQLYLWYSGRILCEKGTVRPTKPKIFTAPPFTLKACLALV